MPSETQSRVTRFTTSQLVFQELFVGTLVYVAILGLFSDYTNIVNVRSFSTILFASIVLELLTFVVSQLKSKIITTLKTKSGAIYRFLIFFFVWLVMFLSKFVFIWALDVSFGDYISIHGFLGILAVVLAVTIVNKLAYFVFQRLGDKNSMSKHVA